MSFKKVIGLFSSAHSNETKEGARKRQNQWIKAQQREWQLAWHDLFDQDPGQATADNAAKGDDIPDELDRDYRLIHGFCEVTVETRAACFALLPHGQKLAHRFEQFYNSRNASISHDDAEELAKKLHNEIGDCTVNFKGDWSHIVVADKDDKAVFEKLELEYSVYDIFEKSLLEPHSEKELPELAASLFLTEISYAAAGNYYQPGQWIEGVYREPAQDRCLGIVYELWLGGWDLLVGSKGLALIPMQDE